MKSRMALLTLVSLLFGALAGAAEPVTHEPPTVVAPAWIDAGRFSCDTIDLKVVERTPKPLFASQHSLFPPCIAMTECSNGQSISCGYTSYNQNCIDRPGCWIICDNQFQYCPDAPPECYE
jgi:hypothetical protein